MASRVPTNVSSTSHFNCDKSSFEVSRTNSTLRESEAESLSGPVCLDALGSASVAAGPASLVPPNEPAWPRDWRADVCLLGCFFLMFNSWGVVNAYGSYASFYMQHLIPGLDFELYSLIGSTQCGVVLFFSMPVGRFADAGHIRQLLVAGTVLTTISAFLLSGINGSAGYDQGNYGLIWLTQGFLGGLGMTCFFVPSSQVVATWFGKRKGFAIGIVASGASIAGIVYPIMLKSLINQDDFDNAQRYVATLTVALAIATIFMVRPNPAHQVRKPEKWRKLDVFFDIHAFRNASFCWFTAAICFLFMGFYAVFFTLEEWAAVKGFGYRDPTPSAVGTSLAQEVADDAIRTFYLLAIMNGSSTIGRLSSSYLCDHFGALNVHATVTFIASLLVLVLWSTADSVKSAIAFVVTFGIFSGAVIGLPPASVAYILGPDPAAQAKLGQWTGMMYSTSAVFALTGPVIAGHLITKYDQRFITVQLWAGLCMLLSSFCMCMARLSLPKSSRASDNNAEISDGEGCSVIGLNRLSDKE